MVEIWGAFSSLCSVAGGSNVAVYQIMFIHALQLATNSGHGKGRPGSEGRAVSRLQLAPAVLRVHRNGMMVAGAVARDPHPHVQKYLLEEP